MLYERFEYVLALAEERNLTKAAQKLYISQPTLTQYINRLEDELGVKLFDRTKSPISITDEGMYYIQRMKQVSQTERQLRSDLSFMANPRKSLSIGIGSVRGFHWIPIIIPEFRKLYPDVNIKILQKSEEKLYECLKNQTLDLAIGGYPMADESFQTDNLLMWENFFFIAHRKFGIIPEQERSMFNTVCHYSTKPEKFCNLPFITPGVGNGMYQEYEKVVSDFKICPSSTISVDNLITGVKLAINGCGVQMVSGPVLDLFSRDEVNELDCFVPEGFEESRRCIAVFKHDSIKKDLINDLLHIIDETMIPKCTNCSF